jgi:hypothetical protein
LRGMLTSRFFLNLRHIFFEKDKDGPGTLSSFKVKIPTIVGEDFVGNLGAPLRGSPVSGPYPSAASDPSRQLGSPVGADPLLDRNTEDMDDEDLEDVEITSRRPMLVGLGIGPSVMGQGSGRPLWRREYDGIGLEEEEAISLMDPKGKSTARTPVRRARSHPMGDSNQGLALPGRQLSESTVDEVGSLLADKYGYGEGLDRDSRESTEDFYRLDGHG